MDVGARQRQAGVREGARFAAAPGHAEVLCRVCGRPADRTGDGLLWLITEDPGDPGSWPGPLTTAHPPVCLPCATWSVRACPYLRTEYVALRVREFAPAGVHGALYRPGAPNPVVEQVGGVEYGDPRIRWVRAGQLIMRLDNFTAANLRRDAADEADARFAEIDRLSRAAEEDPEDGGRPAEASPADDVAMDAYLDAIDRGVAQRARG